MAAVAYEWLNELKDFMNKNSDPRTKGWPFMDSPVPLITLSICYLYFVCKVGPEYMKNRKPYNLRIPITIYNIFQILSCIYLIYGMLSSGSFSLFECDEKGHSVDSRKYNVAKLIWWTLMLKLTEYIETVFFVLRKKQNQVSGLHLYHHVSTLSFAWLTSKFAPENHPQFQDMNTSGSNGVEAVAPIVINCFIHILMYSYYLTALLGGKELQKKIILWKRYLTILQMIQFTVIIIHLITGITGRCSGPIFLLYLMLFNIFINYFMFYKFYRKTYKKVK